MRKSLKGEVLVIVLNLTPIVRENYRVGVLKKGFYKELLNSDSSEYWGGNVGNFGGVDGEKIPWHGKPCSIKITIPPLAGVIFKMIKKKAGGNHAGKENQKENE